jgi:hypothetical protein
MKIIAPGVLMLALAATAALAAEPAPAAPPAPPAPATSPQAPAQAQAPAPPSAPADALPDLGKLSIAPEPARGGLPPLAIDPSRAPAAPLVLSGASPLDSRTLSRRIITAMGVDRQVEAGADARLKAMRTQLAAKGKSLPPDRKKALMSAFAEATTGPRRQMTSEITNAMAGLVAQRLSHDELAQVLQYMESPIGQAQTHAPASMSPRDRETAEATIAATPALQHFFAAWRDSAPAIDKAAGAANMLFMERFNARFCRGLVAAGLSQAPSCPPEPK